jgi:dipeptidyl aminopeptidase/acylaminoacyl peptidase
MSITGSAAKQCTPLRGRLLRGSAIVLLIFSVTAPPAPGQVRAYTLPVLNGGIRRPATVADAIRMTRMVTGPQYSPDGKWFVVVTKRGDLEHNANIYSLLLWNAADVVHSPEADVLVAMSSTSNREAIKNVTWTHNSETLAFLGENPGETQQLYLIDIRTRVLRKLTHHPTNVVRYSLAPMGDRIAYLAEISPKALVTDKVEHEGVVISTQFITDIIAGRSGLDSSGNSLGDFGNFQAFITDVRSVRALEVRALISKWGQFAISPDGRYIVCQAYIGGDFPDNWKEYTDPTLHEFLQQPLRSGQVSFVTRFVLIDTNTGDARVLLNTPIGPIQTAVAWSPDSRSLLLAGVLLPLDGTAPGAGAAKQSQTFLIELGVRDNQLTVIANEDLISHHTSGHSGRTIQWDEKAEHVTYQLHDPAEPADLTLVLRKDRGTWLEVKATLPVEVQPRVVLVQSMNESPQLFSIDSRTHSRILLLDLNPQFKTLQFGKVDEINWKRADGKELKGGLYYPVDYVPGKRYPLVIQSHGWTSKEFWIDGPYTTAFAAQALAGTGVMVFQADEVWYGSDFDTPNEVTREVGRFEGAIEYLTERAMVDPNRIGLIGFSRTGMFLAFALTQSKYKFAAASVTDSGYMGFSEVALVANAAPEAVATVKRFYGGLPYGDARNSWIDRSPEFNWDRVETPLRMLATNSTELLGMWTWYTSLLMLDKPVEMVYLPEGTHVLEKPWDRLVSQQGNVDWFRFWLKDEEDPDPVKAEQYSRWRALRKRNNVTANVSP